MTGQLGRPCRPGGDGFAQRLDRGLVRRVSGRRRQEVNRRDPPDDQLLGGRLRDRVPVSVERQRTCAQPRWPDHAPRAGGVLSAKESSPQAGAAEGPATAAAAGGSAATGVGGRLDDGGDDGRPGRDDVDTGRDQRRRAAPEHADAGRSPRPPWRSAPPASFPGCVDASGTTVPPRRPAERSRHHACEVAVALAA